MIATAITAAVGLIVAALTFLGWLALAGAADDDSTSRASGDFSNVELQQ